MRPVIKIVSVLGFFVLALADTHFVAAGFFVAPQAQGETTVTLYPIEAVVPNQAVRISFGVPFPKGFITNTTTVRLLDASRTERQIFIKTLTPWRNITTGTDESSLRAVFIQADIVFPDANSDGRADAVPMIIEWGRSSRTTGALSEVPVRNTWVQVNDSRYPAAHNVYEPRAFALFSPQWYGDAVIKTKLLPLGSNSEFAVYDTVFPKFSDTMINDVDPRVTEANKIQYLTDYEPWLFDRAMTLYQAAFRTGNVKYLREAHRATQFYANHITAEGYFDLRGAPDLKYSYGESISSDYWLTGDDRLPAVLRRMIPQFDDFNATYSLATNFWTERHAAYKLLGYVSSFELLGDAAFAQKARDTFTILVNMQNNPVQGAANNGCLMHTSASHGEGNSELIASPWMSTLLIDGVERYYIHSGDTRVKQFAARFAECVSKIGESAYWDTEWNSAMTLLMPYYLAGPGLTSAQHDQDPWADVEHGIDVSKILAFAYYFSRVDGVPNTQHLATMREFLKTGNAAFNYWVRPGGPAAGLAEYRLSPPRKYNWWFRTTADIDWLVSGTLISSPTPTPTPTSTPVFKPGDIDRDGDVDIFDYNRFVGRFGQTGVPGWIPEDIDSNGIVNIFDYNILVGNFGR